MAKTSEGGGKLSNLMLTFEVLRLKKRKIKSLLQFLNKLEATKKRTVLEFNSNKH
jgi:hypothetical protein